MPMPLSGLAQTLSNSVAKVQSEIVDVQEQLAAGTKTLNPGQNGVVTRLSAQAEGYNQTLTNIGTGKSVIAVAQAALTSISSIITQMQSLANQASSAALTSTDRDSLNATFTNLATQVSTLQTSSSVNGNNLLSGTNGINVTTGINGTASDSTNIAGVDIATLATAVQALSINSAFTIPTNTLTANVHQVDTITVTGATSALNDTLVIGGLTFTANGAISQANYLQAVANYINGVSSTSSYGDFTGSSVASMQALYSSASVSGGTLLLTWKASGTQTVTTQSRTGTGITASSAAITTASVNQIDTVDFGAGSANLPANQAVSVGGLVFTAGSAAVTAAQLATAYAAYITSGTLSNLGTFSGTSQTTIHGLYSGSNGSATASGNTLALKSTDIGTQTSPAIVDSGALNAAAAVAALKSKLQTVSTGQSTLSAAATGLDAQLSNNTALKTGLTNTVNSIQNIDATAMQAKLQQLNNQQSIDYYLVSQMNTEAAAILSIFR
jgi:flagellin-like hook-associated protein FlgL